MLPLIVIPATKMGVRSEIPLHGSPQCMMERGPRTYDVISDIGQEAEHQDEEETRPMSAWDKGYVQINASWWTRDLRHT